MNDDRHRAPWPACHRRPIRRNARGSGRGGGGGGPVPFDPSQIAGLEAWYRGDSYAGGVALDRSGNGRGLSAVGTAPAQVSRAGQLAFSFVGAGHLVASFGTTLPQPLSVYAIIEQPDIATSQYIIAPESGTSGPRLYSASSGYRVGTTSVLVAAIEAAKIKAICGVLDGEASAAFVDDFVTESASGDVGSAGMSGISLGAVANGSSPMTGFIWEAIVCSGAHDATTRAKFASYFNARYAGLQIAT